MNRKVKRLLFALLGAFILCILLYPSDSSEAYPRRRSCNPNLGKQRAMEYLQSNERLALLAGVEYRATGIDSTTIHDDGEILTDIDESTLDADGLSLHEMEEMEAPGELGDINDFQDMWLDYMDEFEEQEDFTAGGISKKMLMESILSWFGTRYRFGGTTAHGIDCSAFMQEIFGDAAGVELPRTARWQHQHGLPIERVEELRFGDLVFFHTRRRVRVSHVGIYLGDNLFAHASSRYGVTISSLQSSYYSKAFIGGKRLLIDDVVSLTPDTGADKLLPIEKATNDSDTLSSQQ